MDHHRQVRRTLARGHAQRAHLFRQARQCLRDAVLHLYLGAVDIGTELEYHRDLQAAVLLRLRVHVDHVLDADDLLLQRRGHGAGYDLRVGARVLRGHHYGRRADLRIFGDRQHECRDRAADQDQKGEHAGEDRALNEEVRKFHGTIRWSAAALQLNASSSESAAAWAGGAASGLTVMPGRIFARPLTTMRSPGLRPARTMRRPWA